MYIIAYISRASDDLSTVQIEEILQYAMRKNSDNDINGILLYKDGNFLQVLEGEKSLIMGLYQKIIEDDRHDNILVLFEEESNEPIFQEYKSKFNLITSSIELIGFKEYLKHKKRKGQETDLSAKLNSFLGMEWFIG